MYWHCGRNRTCLRHHSKPHIVSPWIHRPIIGRHGPGARPVQGDPIAPHITDQSQYSVTTWPRGMTQWSAAPGRTERGPYHNTGPVSVKSNDLYMMHPANKGINLVHCLAYIYFVLMNIFSHRSETSEKSLHYSKNGRCSEDKMH